MKRNALEKYMFYLINCLLAIAMFYIVAQLLLSRMSWLNSNVSVVFFTILEEEILFGRSNGKSISKSKSKSKSSSLLYEIQSCFLQLLFNYNRKRFCYLFFFFIFVFSRCCYFDLLLALASNVAFVVGMFSSIINCLLYISYTKCSCTAIMRCFFVRTATT